MLVRVCVNVQTLHMFLPADITAVNRGGIADVSKLLLRGVFFIRTPGQGVRVRFFRLRYISVIGRIILEWIVNVWGALEY